MIKNISAMSINIIKLNNTKIIGSYKRIRGDLDFGLEKMKFVLKNVKALKLETVRLDCSIHMSKTREKGNLYNKMWPHSNTLKNRVSFQ